MALLTRHHGQYMFGSGQAAEILASCLLVETRIIDSTHVSQRAARLEGALAVSFL
jgi:hypothetical protein